MRTLAGSHTRHTLRSLQAHRPAARAVRAVPVSRSTAWNCSEVGDTISLYVLQARHICLSVNPESIVSTNAQVFGDPDKVKYFVEPLPAEIEQVRAPCFVACPWHSNLIP